MKLLPKPGQVFRNYKSLCEFLGEPVQAGSSKIAQLKRWSQFFTWTKNGHQIYIINYIDTMEGEKISHRWKRYIDPQIILLIYQTLSGYGINRHSRAFKELILYTHDAFDQLGLCNKIYKELESGEVVCTATPEQQSKYYNEAFPRMHKIFNDALKRLHEGRNIYYIKTYIITTESNPEQDLATEEQRIRIELLKGALLREFDKPDVPAVIRSGRGNEFYRLLRILAGQTEYKIKSLYSVYRIAFTEDSLDELQKLYIRYKDRERFKTKTNQESFELFSRLFKDPPFDELNNLVILQSTEAPK